jgi:hypothetical protein
MHNFQIGDKVEAIYDTIAGKVLKVFDDQVVIETNEGFQLQYHSSELVALSGEEPIRVSDFEVAQAKS